MFPTDESLAANSLACFAKANADAPGNELQLECTVQLAYDGTKRALGNI